MNEWVIKIPPVMAINGRCTECGECCSEVLPLCESDVLRIYKYIKQHSIEPTSDPRHISGVEADCPFRDRTKQKEQCLIYEVRPSVCRNYICSNFPECLVSVKDFPTVNIRRLLFNKDGSLRKRTEVKHDI